MQGPVWLIVGWALLTPQQVPVHAGQPGFYLIQGGQTWTCQVACSIKHNFIDAPWWYPVLKGVSFAKTKFCTCPFYTERSSYRSVAAGCSEDPPAVRECWRALTDSPWGLVNSWPQGWNSAAASVLTSACCVTHNLIKNRNYVEAALGCSMLPLDRRHGRPQAVGAGEACPVIHSPVQGQKAGKLA